MRRFHVVIVSTLAVTCLATPVSRAQNRPEADGFQTTMDTGPSRARACTKAKTEMYRSRWHNPAAEPGQYRIIGDDGCECHEDPADETRSSFLHEPWTCEITFYYKRRPMPWER